MLFTKLNMEKSLHLKLNEENCGENISQYFRSYVL